ncbi:trafficking protein particle complex subunit Bet5p [Trichomonascus vanleenenianus]|uniref:TRAPP subunit BET5 n=1 Tax=Trichomonascus vanleenenianus TaxID=2268995 RepID=UPI003ECB0DCE
MIYSFWLFDRHSECIYKREWHTAKKSNPIGAHKHSSSASSDLITKAVQHKQQQEARDAPHDDDAKLIFGIVFSLRNMVRKLTDEDSFVTYRTSKYRLHYFETPSNLKFVMITDPKMDNLRLVLHQIYVSLYVEYVVKNPLSPIEHGGGAGVSNELFVLGLDAFVSSLPGFD